MECRSWEYIRKEGSKEARKKGTEGKHAYLARREVLQQQGDRLIDRQPVRVQKRVVVTDGI